MRKQLPISVAGALALMVHLLLLNIVIRPDKTIDLCALIGDALLKFNHGDRFSTYIPHVEWNVLERDIGLSPSTHHLIAQNNLTDSASQMDRRAAADKILDAILASLDVSRSDFTPDRPLTTFGLDSFAATRISHSLRPYVNISQMQLLGGITWGQILERIDNENPK